MRVFTTIIVAGIIFAALPAFTDRHPSEAQGARIGQVLVNSGYDSWGEIKMSGDKWIVANARSIQDGHRYILTLSPHGYGVVDRKFG